MGARSLHFSLGVDGENLRNRHNMTQIASVLAVVTAFFGLSTVTLLWSEKGGLCETI